MNPPRFLPAVGCAAPDICVYHSPLRELDLRDELSERFVAGDAWSSFAWESESGTKHSEPEDESDWFIGAIDLCTVRSHHMLDLHLEEGSCGEEGQGI